LSFQTSTVEPVFSVKLYFRILEMKKILCAMACVFTMSIGSSAMAAGGYNDVPKTDPQYLQCLVFSLTRYDGGTDRSPVPGQTKVEAFCECLWNETPDNFKGNLAVFSESSQGASVNRTCEKHANWKD
jgi:hypothetical protein